MSNHLNIIQENKEKEPLWYEKGLHFKCTGCGKCCTGAPGYVWFTDEELVEMANFLKITPKEFAIRYTRRVNGRLSLVEMSKNYDCVFLKDNRCSIYPVRPKQCRTYPWWTQNLNSKEAWEEEAKHCEGIRFDAPLVPFDTIKEQLSIQESNS